MLWGGARATHGLSPLWRHPQRGKSAPSAKYFEYLVYLPVQRIELGFLRVSNFLPGESARSWGRDRSAELLEVWVGRRKRSASFIRTGPRSLAVYCPGPQCPVTHLEVAG